MQLIWNGMEFARALRLNGFVAGVSSPLGDFAADGTVFRARVRIGEPR